MAPPEDEGDLPTLLEAYARNLLGQLPCMRMTDHTARRGLYNTPELGRWCTTPCNSVTTTALRYAGLRSQLPVPLLKIESDGTTQSREQRAVPGWKPYAEGFAAPQKGDTPMPSHGYFAGIDSGSATTDVVILDQDKTIVAKVILPISRDLQRPSGPWRRPCSRPASPRPTSPPPSPPATAGG